MRSNELDPFLLSAQRNLSARADAMFAARLQDQAASTARTSGAHKMALDPSSVHVNQPLENVLMFYKNRKAIAAEAMPRVPVQKQSNVYYELATDTAFDAAKVDVAGQLGQVSEASLSFKNTSTYFAVPRALRDWVSVETDANADAVVQPLARTETNLARLLTLAYEVRVAGKVFLNTNYGSNHSALAGGDRWDTSTGLPVTNTFDAIQSINVNDELAAIYGEQVWNKLIINTEAKSFITNRPSSELGATPMFLNEETWAKAFGLRKVLVGRMKSNSVNDPGTASFGWIWGKSAALIQCPEAPGMEVAAFGYTFEWRPFTHRVYLDQTRGVEGAYMIQVSHAQDEKVVNSDGSTGFLHETCVS